MIRRRHIPESHSEHPNVVPLIDVMLCIIVFYMLAARIGVETGADKTIQIPVTALGRELTEIGTNNIIVNVREAMGAPSVTAMVENGRGVQTFSVDGKVPGQLRDALRALIIGRDGKPNTDDDRADLGVIVRGDGEMSYKSFMPVMVAITDAGVKNIFHNTAKPENTVVKQ